MIEISGWFGLLPRLLQLQARILAGGLLAFGLSGAQAQEPVYIGFDGAYGIRTNTAPQAIERGIRAAMDEINEAGGVLGGRPLRLLTTDNQGIPARAKDNFLGLAGRPDLIAVLGGKYSPTMVESIPEAQRLKIPLISVWGSADPITEHDHKPSYVFRLSLKDNWGAEALLQRAVKSHQAKRVCTLLPNTAWGRSNGAVLEREAANHGLKLVSTRWFNLGETSFRQTLQNCRRSGAQVLVLVANEAEAAVLFNDMAQLPQDERLPIVAHWGLTGGLVHELAGDALEKIDLEVIQTFSFVDNKRPAAVRLAQRLMKETDVKSAKDIASPVGAAQAYDMTYLLAQAVNRAGSTRGDAVRNALVNLPPHEGAVRRYAPAFTPSRHDALGAQQVLFVRVERSGALLPIR